MENLKYQNGKLEILDQRLLPNEAKWLPIGSKEAAFEAIQTLAVRGAPAIGIFAAFSMALFGKDDPAACKAYLDSARPTAVNLSWATARLAKVMENVGDPVAEALAVQAEDIEMCRKISAYGLSLLRDGDGLLTHCNAGELATSRYAPDWVRSCWARKRATTSRCSPTKPVPCCKGHGSPAMNWKKPAWM